MPKKHSYTPASAAKYGARGRQNAGFWHSVVLTVAAREIVRRHRANHPIRDRATDAIRWEAIPQDWRANIEKNLAAIVIDYFTTHRATFQTNLFMGPPMRGQRVVVFPGDTEESPILPLKHPSRAKQVAWNSRKAIRAREKFSKGPAIPQKLVDKAKTQSGKRSVRNTIRQILLRERESLNHAIQDELERRDFRDALASQCGPDHSANLRSALEQLGEDESIIEATLAIHARDAEGQV